MSWIIFWNNFYNTVISFFENNWAYILIFSLNFLLILYIKYGVDYTNFLFNSFKTYLLTFDIINDLHVIYLSEKNLIKKNNNKKK